MTVIELPDDQAAALKAKAAAQGLTLQDWLKEMAIPEPKKEPPSGTGKALELPILHLGVMGPLHRRDIYDDGR
jgi:hypothetical protein